MQCTAKFRSVLWMCLIVESVLWQEVGAGGLGKKLIATGWDHADDKRLRENLEVMESRPFDGIVLEIAGTRDDAKSCPVRQTFSRERWQQDWFEDNLQRLKGLKFRRFTDNFLLVGANPGDVDWFDDAGWSAVIEHWRIAAWVAKQGGLKGLLFDPEPYAPPHEAFTYHAQSQRDRHSFAEYAQAGRRRGREVMNAIVKEYPDITILCYFLGSYVGRPAEADEPQSALESASYGLLPAFLDGWLDAAPPTVKVVDGCEAGYRFNSEQAFLEAAVKIKGIYQRLVSPENRAKYRSQVQVGFGIYLDAYVNPKESPWYIGPDESGGGSRVDRLRANVTTALHVADEYVWIYGEKYRWWPTPNRGVSEQSWPDVLPGCDAILGFARDPVGYARSRIEQLRAEGKLENLARNGSFDLDKIIVDGREIGYEPNRPPVGFGVWQKEDSKGSLTWDRQDGVNGSGAAMASGVTHGCFIQEHTTNPGQTYAIRVLTRATGKGSPSVVVRWKDADGRWTAEMQDRQYVPAGTGQGPAKSTVEKNWQEVFGAFRVPESVGRIVILLNVIGQQKPDDKMWFDNLELYRLD